MKIKLLRKILILFFTTAFFWLSMVQVLISYGDDCIIIEEYRICSTFSNAISYLRVDDESYVYPFDRPKVISDESKYYIVHIDPLPHDGSVKQDMILIFKRRPFYLIDETFSNNSYEFVCPDDFDITFELCLDDQDGKLYFPESVGFFISVTGNISLDDITITKLDK
jgi:hypothetical protein